MSTCQQRLSHLRPVVECRSLLPNMEILERLLKQYVNQINIEALGENVHIHISTNIARHHTSLYISVIAFCTSHS
jgi:hypothetical protein